MGTKEYPILMWSLLIVAFCVIMALHIIENKKFKSYLQKKYDPASVKKILYFSLWRSIQFFAVVMLFFLIISQYDWQIRELTNQLQTIKNTQAIEAILKAEPAPEENLWDQEVKLEPLPDNKKITPGENTIQDIYNISDSQSEIDNIKTRYEELIVNYFLMQKCGKTSDQDYQIIILALQKEMATSLATPQLQNDVLTAAKGSYEELYSQTNCSDPAVESASTQYHAYINSLQKKNSVP